jgi:hypothetical protein
MDSDYADEDADIEMPATMLQPPGEDKEHDTPDRVLINLIGR